MVVYPNQKIVRVKKVPVSKNEIYTMIRKDVQFDAIAKLTHNELKAFLYISSNQDNYRFALSTEDMATKLNASREGMRKGINGLIEKGYLECRKGNEYIFYETTNRDQKAEDTVSEKHSGKAVEESGVNSTISSVYHDKNEGEIIQEEYRENTVDYRDRYEKNSFSEEWTGLFHRLQIGLFDHTMKRLEDAVGETLDAHVVEKIVDRNWASFEKGMSENEGYRLVILEFILRKHYRSVKRELQEVQMSDSTVLRSYTPYMYEGLSEPQKGARRRSLEELMDSLDDLTCEDDSEW